MAILSFLFILSILILVHEVGHFLIARKLKVKIEEFGFGYPPRLLGKKIGETIYSLNLLPFGGFVRLLGEDLEAGKNSFAAKSKITRVTILLAGVVMNFLLGVFLFAAIYTKTGIPEPVDYLTVTQVAVDSPAAQAGFQVEDKIIDFKDGGKFIDYINANRGITISFTIVNKNVTRQVSVMPRLAEDTPAGQGALGIGFTNIDLVLYPMWQRPFLGMWVGLKEALGWGENILQGLGTMVSGLFRGVVPKDVAGPVGIYEISKDITKLGFLATLQFMGILSINLAILNLLPLPALDGGRLLFIGLETIFRRRIKPQFEQIIHLTGMIILIGLMILVTINDVRRLVN